MKKVTSLLIAVLTSLAMMAQAPQSFKYQTVARNNAGDVLVSQNISFRMSIVQGELPGTVVYTETHAATTNAFGVTTLEIGHGTPIAGSFASINWSTTPIFLKTEIDPAGGSAFVEMGTSELLSVPYALYAENTANNDDADADPSNELQTISKDGQTVTLSNGGGSFTDEVNDADPDPANELQSLTQNGLEVSLSQGGGTINVADNDNDPANELQQITKVGSAVTLSQGGGSFNDENTTYTAGSGLQLSGTTFSNTAPDQTVSITPGTGITKSGVYPNFTIANSMPDQTVTITPGTGITKSGTYPNFTIGNSMPDQTVTIGATGDAIVTGTYPNFTINANPTNELQTLSQNGLEVSLSQNGGTINVADNDNDFSNELQTLSKEGNVVSLSQNGGSFVDEVDDADADPVNELQTVTETGYHVTISQGGGSFMTGVKSCSQTEIDALTPYNGLTVHNATTNCINYYFLNNWFEACGTCTPQPTQANAGADQSFTDNTVTTTLAANTPTHGTGQWTVQIGEGGSFDHATNPTATFTGEPCTSYTLAWSIITSCGNSTDNAEVSFFASPTIADAGNDTVVEGGDVTLYLSANTPIIGAGIWSVLDGEGGTFEDATNPATLFTGLPEVTYTLQWVIATVCDTSYDEVTVAFYTWQCGSPFTDTRDSKTYNTVQIGDQCWMAENLKYLPSVSSWLYGSFDDPFYYVYGYEGSDVDEAKSTTNYQTYGSLYNFASAIFACPAGWILPTNDNWIELINYVGGESVAGGMLKETGTIHWQDPNVGATNSYGFTSLPGGHRSPNVNGFSLLGILSMTWSSTIVDGSSAVWYNIENQNAGITLHIDSKTSGFSVRCLKVD